MILTGSRCERPDWSGKVQTEFAMYRDKAWFCRRKAENSSNKTTWLAVADRWERLAEQARVTYLCRTYAMATQEPSTGYLLDQVVRGLNRVLGNIRVLRAIRPIFANIENLCSGIIKARKVRSHGNCVRRASEG